MDLNLLLVLDALLADNSVTRAAERLGTSPAAVSRKLASLRRIVGDPLLVRAGQALQPTARALELRGEVRALIERSESVLTATDVPDPATLHRVFTVQAGDFLLAGLAAPLISTLRSQAPHVSVVFLPESFEGTPALRQGVVDLELGVLGHLDPETCSDRLITTALVGVARQGHPLFDGPIDARRFAEADHISTSRTGKRHGPIDTALAEQGLRRRVPITVPGHTSAMLLARTTDLVCLALPGAPAADWLNALGLRTFPVPLDIPPIEIGMAWHPRNDADRAHRWFREHVRGMLARQRPADLVPATPRGTGTTDEVIGDQGDTANGDDRISYVPEYGG
ncbi:MULTISPECIES: LysR family transcriptional regulator [unclassified Saccharopolyspora]|uniref:LysR family transcriptional regulator n=1 Tax=unclassified Saccharopolyspora TaxID=2646250 RepID=UPI001CD5DB51|nr:MULTISPECIES: LysR family transcriptional regulator [unclassified Saccharopolyspora]MCA1190512.1 LysR family transcriptional regulator [Saccharopolyspora sp. 6T]MCA1227196.1 LysR family transcriptional regulator [Saccharopolyspora sp. 6M]MCA1281895.1 LysR family transcriptional regulator [Saccharopolyspora sp. 7B]